MDYINEFKRFLEEKGAVSIGTAHLNYFVDSGVIKRRLRRGTTAHSMVSYADNEKLGDVLYFLSAEVIPSFRDWLRLQEARRICNTAKN